MKAVGDYDAAVGLRLQVEDDQIVYLPVHFSTKLSEVYEPSLEEVMRNARRSLNNALQIACYMRDQGERIAAASALTSLNNVIAFVVDRRLRLKEANQRALDAFQRGCPVSCRQGTVRFARPSTNAMLASSLAMAPRDYAQKVLMAGDFERWIISVNQLPLPSSYELVQGHDYFLVQVHALDAASDPPSSRLLVEAFGLSPSEIRLSQSLASGLMLADAAALNGISYENARQKLKTIFRKTGVASQSELRALLRHLS
nr:helix-turn-helix transcriptional regulator [Rhizobium sp. TCK]